MNPLRTLPVICIIALSLFSACSEKDEFKPHLEGDIVGYAYCFDEYGNKPENFSDIEVFVEPDRKYHAITEEDGRYVIKNVINGTYNLSFEKEGYGTMKLFGIKHLGGEPTVMNYYYGKAPFIYQYITSQITDMNIVNDDLFITFSFPGTYKPRVINLRVYFSTVENFAIESSQAVKNIPVFDYSPTYNSNLSIYSNLPFEAGNKVFFKACIFTVTSDMMVYNYFYIDGADTYFDSEQRKTIYPNLSNESGEFSFIMP